MKEVWKEIKGYEGLYRVSNKGNVFSVRNNLQMSLGIDKYGYRLVTLSNGGQKKTFKAHRLVYEAFVGDLVDGMVIDHINNDKGDNTPSNLRQVHTRFNTSRAKINKTGYRGVKYIAHRDSYGSEIQIENEIYFLGQFETAEMAGKAYRKALSDWKKDKTKPYKVREGYKLCRVCLIEKPTNQFRPKKNKSGSPSLAHWCLECEASYKKNRYINKTIQL
jgi:hypothetical protein